MSTKTVLQVFTGSWCGSCHALIPVAREVAQELGIDVQVLDIENPKVQQELPAVLSITTLPTFSLQQNGLEITHHAGAVTKQQLLSLCKTAMLPG